MTLYGWSKRLSSGWPPLLGAIPMVATHGGKRRGGGLPLLVSQQERGGIARESFRSLRTNLRFLEIEGQRRKTLAITSPQAGAGKSTIAANLALSLDAIGQKTLLVEADLRRPSLSSLWARQRSQVWQRCWVRSCRGPRRYMQWERRSTCSPVVSHL